MTAFEEVLKAKNPHAVNVRDVNSPLACALVADKLHVPLAHMEAGRRSFDERLPEEINCRVTDQVSNWLFVTEENGVENLQRGGVPGERVHLVGNVMISSLMRCQRLARRRGLIDELELEK